MDKIDNVKDETIRTLAQTLKSSGLAASESEAIRMATNMAQTNTKVNNNFEERKEKNIMGLSFLHKEKSEEKPHQEIKEEEAYAEEITSEPKQPAYREEQYAEEQQYREQPQENEEDCSTCGCCCDREEQEDEKESLNDLFEAETKDEFIKQDLIEDDDQPETTREIPVEKKEPKKDLSAYKESSVNLGDVFKFRG